MEVLRAAGAAGRDADRLRVGVAQIAPVWMRRDATLERVLAAAGRAADEGCQLVVFGEALVPGYPLWLERTDGARFNDPLQKRIFARYLDEGVVVERGDLAPLCALAAGAAAGHLSGHSGARPRPRRPQPLLLFGVCGRGWHHRLGASQAASHPRGAAGLGRRRWPWAAGCISWGRSGWAA